MLDLLLPELLIYGPQLILSFLLGCLIGIEREREDKPAGLRTIVLVSVGATIFTLISILLCSAALQADGLRIIANTVVGIGFLGSGVIIKNQNKKEGITTAACLWVMVGIGMLCGLQQYILAIMSSLLVYGVLKLKWADRRVTKKRIGPPKARPECTPRPKGVHDGKK